MNINLLIVYLLIGVSYIFIAGCLIQSVEKQTEYKRRLKNIQETAVDAISDFREVIKEDDKFGVKEAQCLHDAIVFIIFESNFTLIKGKRENK